jgi:hypothetical protein
MPYPVAVRLAEMTGPVEVSIRTEIVAGCGRRCLIEETTGGSLVHARRVLAVPRHPFHKQVCKLSIDAFLSSFGSSSMWTNVIVG